MKKIDSKVIKQLLCESVQNSTTHGLPNVVKSKSRLLKLIWLASFMISSTLCSYMITKTIQEYFNFETVTKIESISLVASPFPTVSICNLNQFTTNYSTTFIRKTLAENGIDLVDGDGSSKKLDLDFILKLRYFLNTIAIANLTQEEKKKLDPSLDYMLVTCMYNLERCSVDDFEWYYDIMYGNCYKFNSGRNDKGQRIAEKMSTRSGTINSLILELFVNNPVNNHSIGISNGVHVSVFNKSNKPDFFNGIDASVGTQTNIAIKRQFINKLPSPYSDCRNDIGAHTSPYAAVLFGFNYSYTQKDCFHMCFQAYLMRQCKCYDLSIPKMDNKTRPCLTFDDMFCISDKFTDFLERTGAICGRDCPLECQSISYSHSTSFSDYPTTSYFELLRRMPNVKSKFPTADFSSLDYHNLKRQMVSVKVYYEDLNFIQITEVETSSLVDLLANIGGTLGLFIGVSFLSFFELVDVIYQIVVYVWHQLKIKRNIANPIV